MDDYKQLVELLRRTADPNFWIAIRKQVLDTKQHVRSANLSQRDLQRRHFFQHRALLSKEYLKNLVREERLKATELKEETRHLLEQYDSVRPLLTAIAPTMLDKLPFFQSSEVIELIDPPQIAQTMSGILGHVLHQRIPGANPNRKRAALLPADQPGKKEDWPPDQGWYFEPGLAWFKKRKYECKPPPQKLLRGFVETRRQSFSICDLKKILDGENSNMVDSTVRQHLSHLRKVLRTVAKDIKAGKEIRKNPLPYKHKGWQFLLPKT